MPFCAGPRLGPSGNPKATAAVATQSVSCWLTGLCLITLLDIPLTSDHWATVSGDVLVVLWTDEVGPRSC